MALSFLTAPNLSGISGLTHAFTTRSGGVSEGPYSSLNLGLATGDSDERVRQNYERLAREIGAASDLLVGTRQVHSGTVEIVTDEVELMESPEGLLLLSQADALITILKGRFLLVRVADCVPILLCDPRRRVVGAVHAGWRGTLANILPNTIRRMRESFGCRVEDLFMAVGPGISAQAFEISLGVASLFQAQLSASESEIRIAGDSAFADLPAINVRLARDEGLRADQVWDSGLCTYFDAERFFSYRRDGKASGRQAALIGWTA